MKNPIVYGTPASFYFCSHLAHALSAQNGKVQFQRFSDGEMEAEIMDLPRGAPAIVVGSTHAPAENFELFCMLVHKAWNLGAKPILGVMPYFGYSRQDKPKRIGQSEGMAVRGRMLSGFPIDSVLLMDLHNPATVSKIKSIRRQLLSASEVFLPEMKRVMEQSAEHEFAAASPDVGRLNVVRDIYSRELRISAVSGDKHRVENGVEFFGIIGDVSGRTVFLIDDIVDTGTTIIEAAQALRRGGAERIFAFATHAVLSGEARQKLQAGNLIDHFYITDTVHQDSLDLKFFTVISVAGLFANRIKEILE